MSELVSPQKPLGRLPVVQQTVVARDNFFTCFYLKWKFINTAVHVLGISNVKYASGQHEKAQLKTEAAAFDWQGAFCFAQVLIMFTRKSQNA